MKLFSISIFMVLAQVVVFAQGIDFGIKAGVNLANVSTDFGVVDDGQKNVTRMHIGVIMDASINESFSIQPQLLYSGKGLYFDVSGHSHTIAMESIDLPIYIVYGLRQGLRLSVGPNFGYYLSGKNTADFPDRKEVVKYEFDGDPFEYKRFDMGVNLMIGYEHRSGFFISANYLKGLNNVGEIPDSDWKSNVLSISLGYMLQ